MEDLDLMKKPEVAEYLRTTERSLDHWIRCKRFPAGVRLGPCLYWKRETVEAWLSKKFEEQANAIK